MDSGGEEDTAADQIELARPYICRLINLSLLIWPSACPLLQGMVSAAPMAASSCRKPGAKVSTSRNAAGRGLIKP